ncbi:zinc ribbon domain-containing protein [Ruminococcus sp. Marseille-P6503]|uniref:zinc ribbon domain-containing protein n=1 Tax=Ruminococcus sp. Marseille-P6503 TaxID=2364796 RepID=UPI000F531613|nr:zinc ribbon domain-containing protein [Ruminococcus sp. Marseille-P6503]
MKCTVCGTELGINDKFCSNCGTRLEEMPGLSKSGTVFGSNPNAVNEAAATLKPSKKSHKALTSVITVVVILLVGIGYFCVRNLVTKTYDFDGFSIKLPLVMDESDDSGVLSAMSGANGMFDAKDEAYENGFVFFGYIMIDFKDIPEDQMEYMTEDMFMSMMDTVFEQKKSSNGYEKESLNGNVLKATIENSKGNEVYNYMTCIKSGTKYYIFDFQCLERYKFIFGSRFEKWADTISFED